MWAGFQESNWESARTLSFGTEASLLPHLIEQSRSQGSPESKSQEIDPPFDEMSYKVLLWREWI